MNPFLDWLDETCSDEPIVNPTDINVECQANRWSFSLSHEQLSTVTHEDVETFICSVVSARSLQLQHRGYQSKSLLFYCWHDKMAGQLQFSLVSVSHGSLPFGCPVETIHDLRIIITLWLTSPYNQGIPWCELQVAESPNLLDKNDNAILQVWIMPIPS